MPDDTPTFDYDVFLSHNAKDKSLVRELATRLKADGLRVWFDDWSIPYGGDIYLAIERGLERSRTLVLVMSENAFGSDWVGLERSTTLFRDPSNEQRRFIPLLASDCRLPDTLRRFRYIDWREKADDAYQQLRDACRPASVDSIQPEASNPSSTDSLPAEGSVPPVAILERKFIGHMAEVAPITGPMYQEAVMSVALSSDGQRAVSASDDKTLKVWELSTGACLQTRNGEGPFFSVAISSDGARMVAGTQDGHIYVYRFASVPPSRA